MARERKNLRRHFGLRGFPTAAHPSEDRPWRLRGKFDYTSLNTDDMGAVSQFAVLIMSEEHGSVVETAKPPQQ